MDYEPGGLRMVVDELRALHGVLSHAGDLAAEMPGVELERAAGIASGAAVVARRIQQVETRMAALTIGDESAGVVVVEAEQQAWVTMSDGLSVLPMVSAPRVAGVRGVSTGISRMDAGGCSGPRRHHGVDVVMIVLFGSVVVTWWDAERSIHRVTCLRHQHVHIPRGTRYELSNPGSVPSLLVLAHSGPGVTAGIESVTELRHECWPEQGILGVE